ncbi:aspartyl protease [Chitinophaga skermanii]|uniref:Aspartyl protease n=1 Tax=Chitinophaga skermanii TaxID=331697 RepID=A0A327QWP4_9BACT|nr:retropepsin-like aspartic protease [Chitinophaga skermanii]RAJ08308.1 aspartyl protease [Chitinophaga skermanii]
MRLRLLSLTLYLLCCSAFSYAQTASKSIPFELLPSGHLLVKATIDGVQGNFVFDTGGGITFFTKAFFNKLKNVQKEDGGYTGFRATGERIDADLFYVKDFELGPIKKAKEEISYVEADFGGIDGIISLKIIEHTPFTIDYIKKQIILETPQSVATIRKTASIVPIQLEQSREKSLTIFSYFKFNDTLTLQVSLDSGAGKNVFRLNSKYLKALGVDVNDTTKVKTHSRKSEMNTGFVTHIYQTQLSKIAAANAPTVTTQDFPAQFIDGLIYDGIMWINWFGNQITFDLNKKELLVRK